MLDADISFLTLGSKPVLGETSAGADARYEPEYAVVLEEIEKLSFSTDGQISWETIAKNAIIVLSEKSKDLQISTHLAVALWHIKGLTGMLEGMQVLIGYLSTYWETGWPSIKRLRGRLNAIGWWYEHTSDFLTQILKEEPSENNSVTEEEQKILLETIDTLDTLISTYMPDATPLRGLKSSVQRLNLLPTAIPEEVIPEEPVSVATDEMHSEKVALSVQESLIPDAPTKDEVPVAGQSVPSAQQKVAVSSVEQGATTSPSTLKDTQVVVSDITSATPLPATPPITAVQVHVPYSTELMALKSTYVDAALAFSALLRKEQPYAVLAWQVPRHVLWENIFSLPTCDSDEENAKSKQTLMPAPDRDVLQRAQQILGDSPTEETLLSVVSMLEDFFWTAPLFLDVQKILHVAMCALGEQYVAAAQCIHEESAKFFMRFPDLAVYMFNDGTPFIAAETLVWLQNAPICSATLSKGSAHMRTQARAAADCVVCVGHTHDAELEDALRVAQECMQQDNLSQALNILDAVKKPSQSANLRILVHQLRFLCQKNMLQSAQALAYSVLEVCTEHKLDIWDPELATFALTTVYNALCLGSMYNTETDMAQETLLQEVRQRIVWLKPGALLE